MKTVEDARVGRGPETLWETISCHPGPPRWKALLRLPGGHARNIPRQSSPSTHPPPENSLMPPIGGQTNSPNQALDELFQQRTKFMTPRLSQTHAQAQASQLSSGRDGGPGFRFRVGTQKRETSDGPKPSALNLWHGPSCTSLQPIRRCASRSRETTEESLKAGKEGVAEFFVSTRFSNTSQPSCEAHASSSARDKSEVPKIPQMARLGA